VPAPTEQVRRHWKEFQPKRYARLEAAGTLTAEIAKAKAKTRKDMDQLMESAGLSWDEAWEMVRQRYLFLPPER